MFGWWRVQLPPHIMQALQFLERRHAPRKINPPPQEYFPRPTYHRQVARVT